jgi:hypothetical protein
MRAALFAALWLALPASGATVNETGNQDRDFYLDIPAQPLAVALEKYGAATGLALFYDAALAVDRRSAPIRGLLAPMLGLELLLRGTGYVPRRTGPDSVSIVPLRRPSVASDAALGSYAPFFASLQSRIEWTLCGNDLAEARAGPIIFRIWVPSSGVIARAEVVRSGAGLAPNSAAAARLLGVAAGIPPAELPQPLTIAVFPALPGDAARCAGKP